MVKLSQPVTWGFLWYDLTHFFSHITAHIFWIPGSTHQTHAVHSPPTQPLLMRVSLLRMPCPTTLLIEVISVFQVTFSKAPSPRSLFWASLLYRGWHLPYSALYENHVLSVSPLSEGNRVSFSTMHDCLNPACKTMRNKSHSAGWALCQELSLSPETLGFRKRMT